MTQRGIGTRITALKAGGNGSPTRSLRDLTEDLDRSRGDLPRLQRLRDELDARAGDKDAQILRLRVINALFAEKKRLAAIAPASPGMTRSGGPNGTSPLRSPAHVLTSFLGARGLGTPDGRSLYRYRVTDDEMALLKTSLRRHAAAGRLDAPTDVMSAEFVLFTAEWFRRSFAGGSYGWEGLVIEISRHLSPEQRGVLVEHGLRWWRRTLLKAQSGYRQFLLTCVLEGGFPTRLLESREHGWLPVHLRRLVKLAVDLTDPNRTEPLHHYIDRDFSVPESFRKEEFRVLCVNLATAVAGLRREVQGLPKKADERASLVLDWHRPEWRQDLPVVIEGSGAERLLDDLLSAPIETFGGNDARCWRLLVRAGEAWEPALRLSADGPIAIPPKFKRGTTRLRATPVGRLADDIRGEIALIEPPGAEGQFLSRARPAAPRAPIRGYSFDAAVTVELRCENEILGELAWKGGDPIRSDVLTFFDEGGDEAERVLTFVGSGSCRARQSPLYVLASARHGVRMGDGRQIMPEWEGAPGRLFRIDAISYVGESDASDAYRIEPGASSERIQSIGVEGATIRGLTCPDGDVVYAGPPDIWKIKANTRSDARKIPGEIYWRHQDSKEWRDIASRDVEPGAIELVWRDTKTRCAHDRRRLVILPKDAKLNTVTMPETRARYTLEQAGDWVLSAAEDSGLKVERAGSSICVGWAGTPGRSVDLRLDAPGRLGISVRAPFPLGQGAFIGADGRLLPPDCVLTLDALRGARAIVDNPGGLCVEPRGGSTRWAQNEQFSTEFPLWSVRDDLEALLSELGELDAEIILTVEPGGTKLRVRAYEMKFKRPEAAFVRLEPSFPAELGELTFAWRSLIDMGESGGRALVPVPLNHGGGGCVLPIDLPGPGVVYARRNRALAVRPTYIDRPIVSPNNLVPLQTAVLVADVDVRGRAIRERLAEIAKDAQGAEADLTWMHALLALPDHLPPATFEVLKALPSCPEALIALVFARPDEVAVERVWRLEQALSFLWVLCRVEMWRAGYDDAVRRCSARLVDVAGFTSEEADETARKNVTAIIERMIDFDEALVAPLRLAGLTALSSGPARGAREIAQDRIRRGGDQPDGPATCFDLSALGADMPKLAPWRLVFDWRHWQGLDAPLFAALAAAGRAKPTNVQRLAMRQARRQDRQHFCDAYAAALDALARLPMEPRRS